MISRPPTSSESITVPPGGTITERLNLSELFVLSKPGAYYLRAKRRIVHESAKEKAVDEIAFSNPIELLIVP